MKTNIASYNFRRVFLLMKRDLVENYRLLYLSSVLSVAVFLFLMYLGVPDNAVQLKDMGMHFDYWRHFLNPCFAVLNYFLMFILSNAMGNMQSKGGRITFLALPATNLEKFVARYVCISFWFLVVVLAGFVAADIIHTLIFPFFSFGGYTDVTELLLPNLFEPGAWDALFDADLIDRFSAEGKDWVAKVFLVSVYLFSYSVFVLGGNYWRKQPFLKTLGVSMVVSGVGVVVMIILFANFPSMHYRFFVEHYNGAILFSSAVAMVCAVVNCCWAYRLFCRSQAVEPKHFNL